MKISEENELALSIITYIGCGFSIACLFVTLLVYLAFEWVSFILPNYKDMEVRDQKVDLVSNFDSLDKGMNVRLTLSRLFTISCKKQIELTCTYDNARSNALQ